MANKKNQIGMDHSTTKAPRGRTSISDKVSKVAPTTPHTPIEQSTQANRPVSAGAGPRRGDRRDTHPLYSTGKDKVKGGKRGPIGNSTRKGGAND